MESDAFGLVKSLSCTEPVVAKKTERYACVTMVINKWMAQQCTEKPHFSWSTFTVNRSWTSRRHRDTNNVGPSAIVSFGKHSGGELRWWPQDCPGKVIGDLEERDGVQVQPLHKVCFFDGTKAHETCQFDGNRVSIIFYELKWEATLATKQQLRRHGFTAYGRRITKKERNKGAIKDGVEVSRTSLHNNVAMVYTAEARVNTAYQVVPKTIVDQECEDEEDYDITQEFADEPGAELISLHEIKMMTGEDREKWVRAMRDEMDSLKALNVHEEMSEEEVFKQYRSKGIPTKIIPGKLVATKKQYSTRRAVGNQRLGYADAETSSGARKERI